MSVRVLVLVAVVIAIAELVAFWMSGFIALTSAFMLLIAVTTLIFQLYKWWRPENNDPRRYGVPDEPRLPGVILVPMRHEELVAGETLNRLANLNHPRYIVVPIIDHPDDPGTAAIAHEAAERFPDRILVAPYPEESSVHNKPTGLNAAMDYLDDAGVEYDWVGIADAEDLFHVDLLRMVDYRFRATGAEIVQCGVQLMNFGTNPASARLPRGPFRHLRRWLSAHLSAWWRAANVLEYYKWFQSRLKLQAVVNVIPLGGNTVFFRRRFLDRLKEHYGTWWDADCLTEDCKIGILASVLGCPVDVVYVEQLVTREETPASLRGLLLQRVRWMQGFIYVFGEGDWRLLRTFSQRVLAVYVLGFQFFQAFSAVFAPFGLLLAFRHKSPVAIALLATVPLALSLLSLILDVQLLGQFGRTFGQKVRIRDYLALIFGSYPYQIVLSLAGIWALARYMVGRNNWVKTTHHGVHLANT